MSKLSVKNLPSTATVHLHRIQMKVEVLKESLCGKFRLSAKDDSGNMTFIFLKKENV